MNGPLAIFGAAVGIVSLFLALWLQFNPDRSIPPVAVMGFYTLGAVLILLHSGALGLEPPTSRILAFLGLIITMIGQFVGAWLVYHKFGKRRRGPYGHRVDRRQS